MKFRPRILIVDADNARFAGYERALAHHGATVRRLPSPLGVTHAVRSLRPHVVAIDRELSGFGGDALVRLLRSGSTDAKLLLYSDEQPSLLAGYATRAGADGWLSKALPPAEFADRVLALASSQ